MQFRDRVAAIRILQCQYTHAERFALRHLMTRNVEELIACQFELGPKSGQIFLDQPQWEFIVPSRNRCVRSKDVLSARFFDGLFKCIATRYKFTSAFESQERGMALVHVPDRGVISQ